MLRDDFFLPRKDEVELLVGEAVVLCQDAVDDVDILSQWPAAVVADGFVDGRHEADGLGQGGDDALVMGDVVPGKGAALPVFEPFLAYLVAPHVKGPNLRRNAFKILGLVDPDPARSPFASFHITDSFYGIVPGDGVGGDERQRFFQQVQGSEFLTDAAEGAEQLSVGGQGQAGKVDLQELCVALPVGGGMEDCVHVEKDILRAEGPNPIALAVGDEGHAETGGAILDECRGEVGAAGKLITTLFVLLIKIKGEESPHIIMQSFLWPVRI